MLEKRRRKKKPTPAIDNKPELYEDLWFVWHAFNSLNAMRRVGFGPSPIVVSDVHAWLEIHLVPYTERPCMFNMITALDRIWMDHYQAKQKEEEEAREKRDKKGRK